jgi:hypothetical protein
MATVANCIVNIGRDDSDGLFVARVANFAGIEERGQTERQALAAAVAAFKAQMASCDAAGKTLPLLKIPVEAKPGEKQLLIAVHL